MSRTRLILLGLLVVVAVSVVATASTSTPASALGSCSKVKTVPGYCVEGVPLENASAEVEGTNSGASMLKGHGRIRDSGNQMRKRENERDDRRWSRWHCGQVYGDDDF